MKTLEACPICDESNFKQKMLCKDHAVSKKHFTVVSCETCKFLFTNPRPKNLAEYYKSDSYISHTNNSKGTFNRIYQTVRKYTIQNKVTLLKSLKKAGLHLDVGCGTGEFLNACRQHGYKTKGIEPSKIARKTAIKNYKLSINESTDLSKYKDGEFDSISLWHVLEHMPHLNETLLHLNRILKPKGKLIVAVPNHKSWDANYYKEYWAAWDVPIHLWHFSKTTIEKLFKKHKLKLVKTKPMRFDSYYVSILSEEFSSGEKKFIKGCIIGFISNLFGVFTKRGHSSITYVFEKDHLV